MGRLSQILKEHKIISIDTNCFIYMLEGGSGGRELKENLFIPLEKGELNAVTSVLTIAEILVKPKSLGLHEVCDDYVIALTSYPHLEVVSFTLDIAIRCAELRAKYKVKTPDAIQIATALESKANLFLTNDLVIPEIDEIEIVFLKDVLQI